MERKIIEEMRRWRSDPRHRALLIRGGRQIGKTYIIREFAEEEYESYLYVDLEAEGRMREIFRREDLTATEILDRLLFERSDTVLVPGKSAIIIDEVQACIPAYSALRQLSEDGRFDIIATGSLLGVRIDDLERRSPMGYVDSLEMFPMDFEEFLWAMGVERRHTEYLRGCIRDRRPIDEFICKRTNDLFRRYMVVGGMPAAVLEYSENRDYARVRRIQEDILCIVGEDAERYSSGVQRLRIAACLDSVPEQLATESGGFRYLQIEKTKGGSRRYSVALMWLQRAGVTVHCHNLREPAPPLMGNVKASSFKVYMSDTGLLTTMMERDVAGEIVNRDPYANNGAVMENAVACALRGLGYPLLFYSKEDSSLEVDFVISIEGEVTAMEVKSGRNKRAKSLRTLFQSSRTVRRAMRISDGNVYTDENGIEGYPLFGPCFLPRADETAFEDADPTDGLAVAFERISDEMTRGDDRRSEHQVPGAEELHLGVVPKRIRECRREERVVLHPVPVHQDVPGAEPDEAVHLVDRVPGVGHHLPQGPGRAVAPGLDLDGRQVQAQRRDEVDLDPVPDLPLPLHDLTVPLEVVQVDAAPLEHVGRRVLGDAAGVDRLPPVEEGGPVIPHHGHQEAGVAHVDLEVAAHVGPERPRRLGQVAADGDHAGRVQPGERVGVLPPSDVLPPLNIGEAEPPVPAPDRLRYG